MLTPTDYQNIKNFDKLNYNHQKVFRYRIKNKCKNLFKDLKYIFLNYKKLRIRFPEKLIPVEDFEEILVLYEDLKKLHQKI